MRFTQKAKIAFGVAMFALLTLSFPNVARSQALNATTSVGLSLNVQVVESLSVSATPSTVSFNGSSGTVSGSSPITITTNYILNGQTRNNVKLYAYFTQAAALNGTVTGNHIQNTQIAAQIDGGSFQTCNLAGVGSAFDCLGGYTIVTSAAPSTRWPVGTATNTMNLQIALGTSTPIDTYTGTLNITAQAL